MAFSPCELRRSPHANAVLQRLHVHGFVAERFHRSDGGFGRLEGRNTGYTVLNTGCPNFSFVRTCAFAAGGVHDQGDLAIDQIVNQVR